MLNNQYYTNTLTRSIKRLIYCITAKRSGSVFNPMLNILPLPGFIDICSKN